MRAMVDEMNRTTAQLHAGAYPLPFFVSYTIEEADEFIYSSCLGSQAQVEHYHFRGIVPTVKIGNYDFNSSIQQSEISPYSAILPLDDNYAAIRKRIWQITDKAYKYAVTTLEWKKAFLANNAIDHRLPDMTAEPPIVSMTEPKPLVFEKDKWRDAVQQLSASFKKHPEVQSSKVSFSARRINRWLVNSEGTRIKDSYPLFELIISASGQASDGMTVSDNDVFAATEEQKLPALKVLGDSLDNLAHRVEQLRTAPKGEEYCGPVLFEGQAAAELFAQVLAPNFGFAEEYIGHESWNNPLKHGLGRRILPKYLSIIDDPAAAQYKDTYLVGGYGFDDDGVPAQKTLLVENGVLKGFCQSRIPTRHCSRSNGHSLRGHGVYNILQVQSSQTSSGNEIKQRLFDLAKDAGLEYVLVVSRMEDTYHLSAPRQDDGDRTPNYSTPSYSIQPSDPIVVYKLYLADGRRELVRGLEFKYISLRAFRDIQAVGEDSQAYLVEPADYVLRHLITPSLLIGELELTPTKSENSTPPILPSPLIAPTVKR